jgi:hypothetical protein
MVIDLVKSVMRWRIMMWPDRLIRIRTLLRSSAQEIDLIRLLGYHLIELLDQVFKLSKSLF